MLYHLFEALKEYDIPGQGLMSYITFRAMMASVTAMLISLVVGKKIIRWLQKKQIGEEIRDLGLEGQMQKKGTPTMGGIIIFIAIMVSVLLFADLTNIYTIILIATTIWFGALGFTDDIGILAAALSAVAMYVDDEARARADAALERWLGAAQKVLRRQ